ncbi:MAG: DUF4860 domain-containing protein [Lachnospiraceae bacterium]|nr:DUF4860 domain-containing protein [Lachnospiraceae bacterium]
MDFRRERHVVDLLFVIALMFLFAFSAIMLIALGADVYQKNVDTMQINYDRRTASAYLIQKVRQSDESGSISIGELKGSKALVLTNTVGESDYSTWLYLYDGMLCEQLMRSDMTPMPQAGQKILPLAGFDASFASDDLLMMQLELENGEEESFFVGLRSDGNKMQ